MQSIILFLWFFIKYLGYVCAYVRYSIKAVITTLRRLLGIIHISISISFFMCFSFSVNHNYCS